MIIIFIHCFKKMLKLARYLQGLKTVPTSKTNNTVQSMNNNNNNDNDKSNFLFHSRSCGVWMPVLRPTSIRYMYYNDPGCKRN